MLKDVLLVFVVPSCPQGCHTQQMSLACRTVLVLTRCVCLCSYPYGPGDMDYNEFMSNLPAFDEVNVDQLPGGLNFFDLMSQYQNSQT
ncbi:hypothetical protein J6590_031719 [Homalodisca vitripennis]|nr:hypothetical protein J6590_031719 [Homalodisca vitripennis]